MSDQLDQRDLRQDLLLDSFWDRLVTGQPGGARDLDPGLEAIARRVHALDGSPDIDSSFKARLWEDLMHASGTVDTARPPLVFGSNGRAASPPRFVEPAASPGARRAYRRLPAYIGAALIAAIILVSMYLIFRDPQNNVAIPPLQPTAVASPDSGAWPMFGGNAARTRNAVQPGPESSPTALWTYPPAGVTNLHASVDRSALTDGVLYMPTDTGALVAVDVATGAEKWRVEGYGGTAVVDGDGLIVLGNPVGGDFVDLARIKQSDGSLVWTAEQGKIGGVYSPVIADGVGYVPTSDKDFIAFDPATGKVLWRTALKSTASRGAAVADGIAVLGDDQGTVYAISTESHKIDWTFETGFTTVGHPSIASGSVYVNGSSDTENAIYALDLGTGAVKWKEVAPSGAFFRGSAIGPDTVYAPGDDGVLYALDAATGAQKWTFQAGSGLVASPVLAGDTLYFCADSGFAFAIDATTGAERWRFQPADPATSGAVVADGVYYITSDGGTTYALGDVGSATPAASPAAIASPVATPVGSPTTASQTNVEWVWSSAEVVNHPLELGLSPDNKLWVPDLSNRFSIFDLDGNLVETWGSSGTGPGQFDFTDTNWEAGSIAFLPDGSFYVADTLNRRIQHFDGDRKFLGAWGSNGHDDGQFLLPAYLAIAADGSVLVTDLLRHDIQRFSPTGTFLGKFDVAESPDGLLRGPGGIAIAPSGTIYVVELNANRVRVFDKDLKATGVLGAGGPSFGTLNYPEEVAVDEHGFVYVTDTYGNRILVFDPSGSFAFQWDATSVPDGQFNNPDGLVITPDGAVYVAEWHGNRIDKFIVTRPSASGPEATPVS